MEIVVMGKFDIKRPDGRSNQQVIIDYVSGGVPGTVYPYPDLMKVLGFNDLDRTRQVVLCSQQRLLKEHQRTMRNVRGVGYKLVEAKEHVELSLHRRRKADVQYRMGLLVLKNVRWDEMDADQRKAHEGSLLLMSALHANQQALEGRQRSVEDAIDRLRKRIDGLEGGESAVA